jgi:hypothetical protein
MTVFTKQSQEVLCFQCLTVSLARLIAQNGEYERGIHSQLFTQDMIKLTVSSLELRRLLFPSRQFPLYLPPEALLRHLTRLVQSGCTIEVLRISFPTGQYIYHVSLRIRQPLTLSCPERARSH